MASLVESPLPATENVSSGGADLSPFPLPFDPSPLPENGPNASFSSKPTESFPITKQALPAINCARLAAQLVQEYLTFYGLAQFFPQNYLCEWSGWDTTTPNATMRAALLDALHLREDDEHVCATGCEEGGGESCRPPRVGSLPVIRSVMDRFLAVLSTPQREEKELHTIEQSTPVSDIERGIPRSFSEMPVRMMPPAAAFLAQQKRGMSFKLEWLAKCQRSRGKLLSVMSDGSGSGEDTPSGSASESERSEESPSGHRASMLRRMSDPDVVPPKAPADAHKLTVVFDLDETLVFAREGPLYVRPGLCSLLEFCGTYCETIVWTTGQRDYARCVLKNIDPRGVIRHCVYRHPKWFKEGAPVLKDLLRMGRSLDQCLVVENTPDCVLGHENNAIVVESYMGPGETPNDRTLFLLTDLLRQLVASGQTVPEFLRQATSVLERRNMPTDSGEWMFVHYLPSLSLCGGHDPQSLTDSFISSSASQCCLSTTPSSSPLGSPSPVQDTLPRESTTTSAASSCLLPTMCPESSQPLPENGLNTMAAAAPRLSVPPLAPPFTESEGLGETPAPATEDKLNCKSDSQERDGGGQDGNADADEVEVEDVADSAIREAASAAANENISPESSCGRHRPRRLSNPFISNSALVQTSTQMQTSTPTLPIASSTQTTPTISRMLTASVAVGSPLVRSPVSWSPKSPQYTSLTTSLQSPTRTQIPSPQPRQATSSTKPTLERRLLSPTSVSSHSCESIANGLGDGTRKVTQASSPISPSGAVTGSSGFRDSAALAAARLASLLAEDQDEDEFWMM